MRKLLIAASILVLLLGGLLLGAGAMHLGQAPAKLTWTPPEFRSSLMTFAYKVYGNPKMEDGRHFLSKVAFKNAGQAPVTDFAISYKIQDYIPWTDPERMPDIPGGFSFVKLYYPRLPAEVTKLRTPTTCALEIKATWKENGKPKEETFKHDILLHPVNELTYSDLPASEVESWYDAFDTSDFAVSMVTPNDPVVTAYAAEISKQAGGTVAGIDGGPKEIYRICQTAYDYMCRTGLRYTGGFGRARELRRRENARPVGAPAARRDHEQQRVVHRAGDPVGLGAGAPRRGCRAGDGAGALLRHRVFGVAGDDGGPGFSHRVYGRHAAGGPPGSPRVFRGVQQDGGRGNGRLHQAGADDPAAGEILPADGLHRARTAGRGRGQNHRDAGQAAGARPGRFPRRGWSSRTRRRRHRVRKTAR